MSWSEDETATLSKLVAEREFFHEWQRGHTPKGSEIGTASKDGLVSQQAARQPEVGHGTPRSGGMQPPGGIAKRFSKAAADDVSIAFAPAGSSAIEAKDLKNRLSSVARKPRIGMEQNHDVARGIFRSQPQLGSAPRAADDDLGPNISGYGDGFVGAASIANDDFSDFRHRLSPAECLGQLLLFVQGRDDDRKSHGGGGAHFGGPDVVVASEKRVDGLQFCDLQQFADAGCHLRFGGFSRDLKSKTFAAKTRQN